MSLTSFVKLPDVAKRLAPFRPVVQPVTRPMKVRPCGGDPSLTGTAFDYLLRFELQRRAPHAVHGDWVAEAAAELVLRPGIRVDAGAVAIDLALLQSESVDLQPVRLSKRFRTTCAQARRALQAFLLDPQPDVRHQREMAGWAVRLAKLDSVYRRNEVDVIFEEPPDELIDELVSLLSVVPFGRLMHPEVMVLNPEFGEASGLVGGADADLIAGDMLVDVKTTRSATVGGKTLDQLFGYFLLARRAKLPPITRVGVYFSRYGYLRTGSTGSWTDRPEFELTERWFFKRAQEVFGPRVERRWLGG